MRHAWSSGEEVSSANLNASQRETQEDFMLGEDIGDRIPVYLKASDGKIYQTDTTVDEATYNFIGFTVESGASGDTKRIQNSGILDGFSGLTAGSTYYLNGTGAISTTPGARIKKIGIAVSTTELLIVTEFFSAKGGSTSGDSSSSDTSVTVGFRPKVILFWGARSIDPTVSNARAAIGSGFAIDLSTVVYGSNWHQSSSTDQQGSDTETSVALKVPHDADYTTITVTFNATGFTIAWGGSGSVAINVDWLAMG